MTKCRAGFATEYPICGLARKWSFKDDIPTDAVSFWSGVLDYPNLVGYSTYGDLAAYALACLTTSTSNAVVERIFICHRNKDKVKEQDDLFHARSHCKDPHHLYFKEKCCKNFVATKRMLELFTPKNMYKGSGTDSNSSLSSVEEDELLF